jgi:hypothetical protein
VSYPAVPEERLLIVKILQHAAFKSSCHRRPCRNLVNCQLFLASLVELNCTANPQLTRCHFSIPSAESELLYDWRFTANQFILVPSPLRPTARIFPQLNNWGHSPYITSSLTRRWVCHLQLVLALASAFILGFESCAKSKSKSHCD